MLMRLNSIVNIACSTFLLIYLPFIPLIDAHPSIWSVHIDESPAPSPEDGPPLSANASRNKALLPSQIGGIIGAYAFAVAVVGLALFLIGRRLRHNTQRSLKALDVEMITPTLTNQFYPSPISPADSKGEARNFSWPSPEKDVRNPYIFPSASVEVGRPIEADHFVDQRVLEADRNLLAQNLEDLYAHVMEQEEAKANGIILKAAPIPPRVAAQNALPAEAPQRRNTLTRLNMARSKDRPEQVNIELATTEKSHSRSARPGKIDVDLSRAEKTQSRTSSLISSLRSPRKKGLKGVSISSPVPTPLSATFPGSASDEEREPLSPRIYSPPPPPPIPTDQVPYNHGRQTSNDPSPVSPTRSIAEQLASSNFSSREPYHRYNPSSSSSVRSSNKHQSANSQTPLVPSVPQAAPAPRALPFRAFESSSNVATSPATSQMTKTTVLERNNTPLSPGLKTPWSAGAVPYSPYQPFTPMMPITPRLVTKEDRKKAKKAAGRGPVTELIKSEDDLWDSGY